jgi:membrane protein
MRILFMIQETMNKISKDNITGYAAQSCFYIVLSIFPFLLVLMSLFKFLPLTPDTLTSALSDVIPSQLRPMMENLLNDLYNNSSVTLTSITAVGTIWAAGKSFIAITRSLNVIYGTDKKRNWLLQRIISTFYTIVFLLLIIATLILLVFGKQLLSFTQLFAPYTSRVLASILNNRLILFPCFMIVLFLLMYLFIPTHHSSIAREFPGAVFAAFGWYFFSYFYSLYVEHSTNFSYMYGSLTTLIFALIWIYVCMVILFLGAEFNTLIAEGVFKPITSLFRRKGRGK